MEMATIVIDPGHGGSKEIGDSSANNATSVSGVKEKDFTLDLAKRLRYSLLHGSAKAYAASKGKAVKVVLTRDKDENLGLSDRAQVAADSDADLFLSIHCNGHPDNPAAKVRGSEAFIDRKYMRPVYKVIAGKSYPQEGPGVPASGVRNVNVAEDAAYASRIVTAFVETLKAFDPGAKYRSNAYTATTNGETYRPPQGVKMTALGVLRDAKLGTTRNDCRACLLECEYIDNATVDQILNGARAVEVRNALAAALGKALIDSL
ncbi:N-acetylmuramoyl-L-alanine amidase [Sphingomonas lacunae]|uniref:N-acetylmuramoyl-L-alanine amidase n=1 Tax=Sphingomonas lacunae TaxID=2698828 RepID=A0A6M4AYW9_9SPHN|nr:N-acetylmuramoyl-L-alanine amidase [Sphingomonas lacunae]QJQ33249.1 N-acetylmuramoyl-L-alanine amidase [Sphingomonas lacunae]